jgi:hypothetical protein
MLVEASRVHLYRCLRCPIHWQEYCTLVFGYRTSKNYAYEARHGKDPEHCLDLSKGACRSEPMHKNPGADGTGYGANSEDLQYALARGDHMFCCQAIIDKCHAETVYG